MALADLHLFKKKIWNSVLELWIQSSFVELAKYVESVCAVFKYN